ncbi:MAG: SPFH domain-containing protein [Chloroflexota bacterium]|nr:SPFH domain-containing protein [Chloroflexota bacterium]
MRRQTTRLGVPVAVVGAVAVLVLGFVVVMLAYTPVDVGTVALVKRFGGLTGEVFEPGLHWRTPFIDQIETIPTVVQSYETSDNPGTSGADYTDLPVNAQTIDGQQITIKYTVLFRIQSEKAVYIVQNVGRPREVVENIVKAHSRNLTRLSAQSHTAEDLYSGEGIFAYEDDVRDALTEEFEKYGVFLDDFLVRKIEFDAEYINAIEQQQIAQEAIETAQYQADAAEYEKQSKIRLAEAEAEGIKLQAAAEAERIRLLAAANAERQRLLADSEAYSIDVRGKALKEFPELVQWEFVRNLEDIQWGILPGEGITPLMPLPSFEGQEETPVPVIPKTPGEGE